jgi:ATP-dependent RNA helicase HelY
MVKAGRLPVRGTYAILPGVKGWLLSSKEVAALKDDPEVEAARERMRKWRAARRSLPLPTCQVRPLKRRVGLRPDPWQEHAVQAATSGKDVLVVAPTGSGKTWVAEELARRALERGAGLIYASPIKALSNQKYLEFCNRFGSDRVGIVTGDVSVNPGAPVVVATTEIVRNWCVFPAAPCEGESALRGARWVVVDEFHLLDSDRGMAWEEVVLSAPSSVGLVCLSATVPNWDEAAAWISEVRGRQVEVIVEERRPVPLSWRWWLENRAVIARVAAREIERLRARKKERRLERVRRSPWYREDGWDEDWDEDEERDDD